MDLLEVRKLILVAVASDDELVELLVLKGGNALELIHKIGARASLDLDFSLAGDFDDPESIRVRLFRALRDRFDSVGLVVFDEKFYRRPPGSAGAVWGGYVAEFKLIERRRHGELGGDIDAMRREAHVSGAAQERIFSIQISKFEYCEGKMEAEVEAYTCYVYTPAMIAVEKLRAICQQMSEYPKRKNPAARARDLYDIEAIVTQGGVNLTLPESLTLIQEMFAIKEVPVDLLSHIPSYREFHRPDWPAVQNAVRVRLQDFDYYFEFVAAEARRILHALRIE
jgi:hypothetical protein